MLDELFDPLSRIKMLEMYINDIRIDNKVLNDKLVSIELKFGLFDKWVMGYISCAEDLFTLTINKNPTALINKDTVKIVFVDNAGKIFERRFTILKAILNEQNGYSDSEYWNITIIDFYGNFLYTESYNKYITQKGYKGTPIKIVENAIKDLFIYADEASNYYGDKKIEIKTESNILDFLDNLPEIEHRFPKDGIPYEIINKFCVEHNILIYQDYNTFHIIQNPIFSKLEKPEDYVYREFSGTKNYCHKICDRIKQNKTIETTDRPNYRISLNEGGKKQTIKKLDFEQILELIELNCHEPSEYRNEKEVYLPSAVTNLSALTYESVKKYIDANNLILYTRPILEYSNVGTVTSVQLEKTSDFAQTRINGDTNLSGFWLIKSSTIKIIKNHLIARLILCRYDNQQDYAKMYGNAVIGEQDKNKKFVPTVHKNDNEEVNKVLNEIDNDIKNMGSLIEKTKEDKERKKNEILRNKR